jgi:hypothetical protein
MRFRMAAHAVLWCLGVMSAPLVAQDRPYTDGPVVNVAGFRTEYGKLDEYLKFLATTWKQEQEAAKKAGLILDYKVYTVEPRDADDPDIYLVVTLKNWAALDNLKEKAEALAKKVYGSTETASQGAVDRGKIRRRLGSMTMQEIVLE